MLFYGTAWIIRGWLTFRSGYLPRLLGVLMVAAGLGFVAKNVTKVLAPAFSSDLLLAPMFLNVLVLASLDARAKAWIGTNGTARPRPQAEPPAPRHSIAKSSNIQAARGREPPVSRGVSR